MRCPALPEQQPLCSHRRSAASGRSGEDLREEEEAQRRNGWSFSFHRPQWSRRTVLAASGLLALLVPALSWCRPAAAELPGGQLRASILEVEEAAGRKASGNNTPDVSGASPEGKGSEPGEKREEEGEAAGEVDGTGLQHDHGGNVEDDGSGAAAGAAGQAAAGRGSETSGAGASAPAAAGRAPPSSCGVIDNSTDYRGVDLQAIAAVRSLEQCCQLCLMNTRCVAWTWGQQRGRDFSDVCYLKAGHARWPLAKVPNSCCISGQVWQTGAGGAGPRPPAAPAEAAAAGSPTAASEPSGLLTPPITPSPVPQAAPAVTLLRAAPAAEEPRPDAEPHGASAGAAPAAPPQAPAPPGAGGNATAPPESPGVPPVLARVQEAVSSMGHALGGFLHTVPQLAAQEFHGQPAQPNATAPGLQEVPPPALSAGAGGLPGSAGAAPPAAGATTAAAAGEAPAGPGAPPPGAGGVLVTAAPTQAPQPCGLVEEGMDYPGNDLSKGTVVTGEDGKDDQQPDPESCCQRCAANDKCVAWTWWKSTGFCYLKGSQPNRVLSKLQHEDFVSGQPTQVGRSIETTVRDVGQSLYCFALMLPYSYEQELLLSQFNHSQSIFACDEYAVYSNKVIEVAPGVVTRAIDSDLKAPMGGEFGTALNTDIFLELWGKVLEEGRFMFHGWTAKVDADAAFFPTRLRAILTRHSDDSSGAGTYLNNCKLGLHGPLEVFSRTAVRVFGEGRDRCKSHFEALCTGPCKWGEDMFIDQCLWKVLHVRRELEVALLLEDHCEPPEGWSSCTAPGVASFHPYKNVDDYQRCMSNANAADGAAAATV